MPKLTEFGLQLIAISPDQPQKLLKTQDKNELEYLLLSDSKMTAARAFGIAYQLDKSTLKSLSGFGIDVNEVSGEKHTMLPVPSVFVIDKNSKIAFSYVNPDYKKRLSPDVLLAAAKAAISD